MLLSPSFFFLKQSSLTFANLHVALLRRDFGLLNRTSGENSNEFPLQQRAYSKRNDESVSFVSTDFKSIRHSSRFDEEFDVFHRLNKDKDSDELNQSEKDQEKKDSSHFISVEAEQIVRFFSF